MIIDEFNTTAFNCPIIEYKLGANSHSDLSFDPITREISLPMHLSQIATKYTFKVKAIAITGISNTITNWQTWDVRGSCVADTISLKTSMPDATEDLWANYTDVDSIPRL